MENGFSAGIARKALQLLSLEQTMTIPGSKMCRRISMSVLCILISGTLLGQTDAAKNANNNAKAGAQAAPADPSPSGSGVAAHNDTYIIGDDDVLSINVWKEQEVSRTVPVRSDGKISLPLAGEVQASGLTPLQLEKALAAKLQGFISEPEVTVIVTEIKSQKFNILGMVNKSGTFPLTSSLTVLDAIALAGGFRDFAKQKSIYVLRKNPDGGESRLPFNYKEVIKGNKMAQNIKLQPGDTIVIP
jgi:polysaccharide biosynthesis/export protein